MATAVLPAGYSVEDRNRIFGPSRDQPPKVRNAEQQKFRAAKRAAIKSGRKPKPKKK